MAEKSNQAAIGDGSLHVGDRVVYPNQGICRITGVTVKNIAGQNWEVVTLSREEDGATVMVPKAKVMGIGLRKVADVAAIEKVFDELASPSNDPQLDWKVRHRENADRMSGGGLFGTVEVLKGLHTLSRVRPLPPKERELYDNARHLLVGEIAAAMDIPLHVAEDNLDYALWPPPGMKRKGKELPPATLGPPAPLARVGEDDLGFEDEDAEDEAAVPAVAPVEEAEEVGEEGGAPAAKKPAKEKPAPAAKAAPAAKPAAHAAAAPVAKPAPHPPAALVAKPAPRAPAAPVAKPASHAPAAPVAKHAAHAPATKPAAHAAPPAHKPAPAAAPKTAHASPTHAPAAHAPAHERPAAKKPAAAHAPAAHAHSAHGHSAHAAPAAAVKKKAAAPAKKAAHVPAKKPAAATAAKKPAAKSKPKGKK